MLICIELFSTIKGGLKALYENNYDKTADHLKIKIGLNYFDRHREKNRDINGDKEVVGDYC